MKQHVSKSLKFKSKCPGLKTGAFDSLWAAGHWSKIMFIRKPIQRSTLLFQQHLCDYLVATNNSEVIYSGRNTI